MSTSSSRPQSELFLPVLALALFAWLAAAPAALRAADNGLAPLPGTWDGEVTLGAQAVHIRCVFKDDPRNRGGFTGDFYSRQNTAATPIDSLTVDGANIEFTTRGDNQPIKFTGKRTGRTIEGTMSAVKQPFIQGHFTLALPADSTPAAPAAATRPGAQPAGKPAAAPPAPTSFAGEWEGQCRLSTMPADNPGAPLWINLAKSPAGWSGTLYIKSKEPGYVLDKLVVSDTRMTAEADVAGTHLALQATRQTDGLAGSFTARDKDGNTSNGSWTAAPATRTGYDGPAAEPIEPGENPATPRPLERETGIPVFPGAEGFGTRTPAGRGGRVIAVTNLNDSGEGSLREALLAKGPRTVVFRVSGNIRLKELLFISEPFVTVAGQSAPGDGVCLTDCGLVITTHDVLVQHLRIRPGNEGPVKPSDNDAVCILGDRKQPDGGAHHIVLDHLSCSWSEDECVSVWGGAREITIGHCLIGEALSRARHDKTTHSAGLLVGDSSDHVTMHHNLLAHNSFRNPLISKGGTHEFVNNLVYDWQDGPCEILDLKSNTFLNFIGNTYWKGPSTTNPARVLTALSGPGKGLPQLYLDGNVDPHHPEPTDNPWLSVGGDWKGNPADLKLRADKPFAAALKTRQTAALAREQVLAQAGATRPKRDSVDRRIVDEVHHRTGKIIDSPADVGGLPALAAGDPPADSDQDGLPDLYETANRLNPSNPADAQQDPDRNGYTNLEEYLQSLCAAAK